MISRLAGLAASLLLSSVALAEQKVTIWWAQWAPADGLTQLGEEYKAATGVSVEVRQIPWTDFQTQVFLEFGKPKTDFDIVVGDSQWIGRGVKDGWYLELTDWMKANIDIAGITPKALKYLCEYPADSARFYAVPCETDAVGFAYRKDWFEDPREKAAFQAKFGRELAVPQTYDELKQVAEFFHRPADKRYGIALLTGRGYDSLVMGYQQVMWAFGGAWFGDGSLETVNSDASVRALDYFKSLLAFGPTDAADLDYGKTPEYFMNGSTAMAMNYFAFFPGIAEQMGDKAGFFAMPTKDGRRAVSLGGQGFSISTKTSPEQQKLAKDFIAWFSKPQTQEKWVTKPAGFTASAAILSSETFQTATPYNAAFAESLKHVQDFWNIPEYGELLTIAQQELGEALDGNKTAKEALDAIAEQHADVLRNAGVLMR
jgi:multiple sugar transport system substrate-binding protein